MGAAILPTSRIRAGAGLLGFLAHSETGVGRHRVIGAAQHGGLAFFFLGRRHREYINGDESRLEKLLYGV